MSKYFRVKAFYPKENMTVIIDSYGKYDKLWQLSAFMVQKGFKILEVWDDENVPDTEIPKVNTIDTSHLIVRSCEEAKI